MDELRRIRKLRGLTQYQLALTTGVNASSICQLEKGRRAPSIYTLDTLARGLDCEVSDFFQAGYRPPARKAAAV